MVDGGHDEGGGVGGGGGTSIWAGTNVSRGWHMYLLKVLAGAANAAACASAGALERRQETSCG